MLNSCCMSHHPLEKMSWCEADLAGTWYRLWQIKCCWQNLLCSVAIPHNTKLDAPLWKRSLLRLRSAYMNYSQWKRCTACSTEYMIWYDSRFLFLCVLMKAAIHLFLWNKPMLCMFWTAWTKHFGFRLRLFLSCQCIFVYQSRLSAGSTGKSSIIMDRVYACVMLWKGRLNYVCIMYL